MEPEITVIDLPGLQIVHYAFEAGQDVPLHDHTYEHWSHVVSGSLMLLGTDGDARPLGAGEQIHFPVGVKHGFRAIERAVLIGVTDATQPAFQAFINAA